MLSSQTFFFATNPGLFLALCTFFFLSLLAFLLASSKDSLPSLLLLLSDLPLGRIFLLRKRLTLLCNESILASFVVVEHATQTTLRFKILLIGLSSSFFLCSLAGSKRVPVDDLLALVVLSNEGSLFFAIGTLDVVDALGNDTELLTGILLLLLNMLHLHTDELLSIVLARTIFLESKR
jgi:hypothetical protein